MQTGKIGGKYGIFAMSDKIKSSKSHLINVAKTMTYTNDPLTSKIYIPQNLMIHFSKPKIRSLGSLYRNFMKHQNTPLGSLNIKTQHFIKNEIFINGEFLQATPNQIFRAKQHQFLLDYEFDSLGYIFIEGIYYRKELG